MRRGRTTLVVAARLRMSTGVGLVGVAAEGPEREVGGRGAILALTR